MVKQKIEIPVAGDNIKYISLGLPDASRYLGDRYPDLMKCFISLELGEEGKILKTLINFNRISVISGKIWEMHL